MKKILFALPFLALVMVGYIHERAFAQNNAVPQPQPAIIEVEEDYMATSPVSPADNMMPLKGDKGVEVAPQPDKNAKNSTDNPDDIEGVIVEEDDVELTPED